MTGIFPGLEDYAHKKGIDRRVEAAIEAAEKGDNND